MLLAAHSVGVSTLWFSLYDTSKIKEILEIPAELDVVSMIVTGYPADPPKSMPRKDVKELTVLKE
jgi:nitroreductase